MSHQTAVSSLISRSSRSSRRYPSNADKLKTSESEGLRGEVRRSFSKDLMKNDSRRGFEPAPIRVGQIRVFLTNCGGTHPRTAPYSRWHTWRTGGAPPRRLRPPQPLQHPLHRCPEMFRQTPTYLLFGFSLQFAIANHEAPYMVPFGCVCMCGFAWEMCLRTFGIVRLRYCIVDFWSCSNSLFSMLQYWIV